MRDQLQADRPNKSTDILLPPSSLEYVARDLDTVRQFFLNAANLGYNLWMPEATFQNLSGIFAWVFSLSSKEMGTKPLTNGLPKTTVTYTPKPKDGWTDSELALLGLRRARASTKKTRKPAKRARTSKKSKARSPSAPYNYAEERIKKWERKLKRKRK